MYNYSKFYNIDKKQERKIIYWGEYMKKCIFLIAMFMLMTLNVHATNDVTITCDKTKLKINEETTCRLNVSNLDFNVTDVTGKIVLGNNLQLTSSSYDKSIWLSLDNTFVVTDINLIRNGNDKVNNITVATFKVKASANATENSTINFNNVALGNSDYESISLTCNPVNINFGNNVNTLESLSIEGYDIGFSKDKTNYMIETEKESITISATATDKLANISGIGNRKIEYGNNTIDIVVTAENGLTKNYRINVNKKDTRSSINNLKSISLSEGKINFNKDVTEYTVNVKNSINKIEIRYELEDSKSKAELIGNTNLTEGENLFTIKVTAENTQVKEYKIKVIRQRKEDIKVSNKIYDLKIKDHELTFDSNTYAYVIKTDSKKLDFEITLEDDTAKYEIFNNENLKDGSIITIKVTDQKQETSEYKIVIQNDIVQSPSKENSNNILIIILLIISIMANIALGILFFNNKNKK